LRKAIRQAGVAMLMNVDENGSHVGRPMLPILLDNDPHIYFLTHEHSPKVMQLAARPRVALTIVTEHLYVVVRGAAFPSKDPQLIRRLWHPAYRAWFPGGRNDPESMALCVVVDRVDYWEPPRSRVVRMAHAFTAIVTRRAAEIPMKTLDGL
jgi:general stress protein 26